MSTAHLVSTPRYALAGLSALAGVAVSGGSAVTGRDMRFADGGQLSPGLRVIAGVSALAKLVGLVGNNAAIIARHRSGQPAAVDAVELSLMQLAGSGFTIAVATLPNVKRVISGKGLGKHHSRRLSRISRVSNALTVTVAVLGVVEIAKHLYDRRSEWLPSRQLRFTLIEVTDTEPDASSQVDVDPGPHGLFDAILTIEETARDLSLPTPAEREAAEELLEAGVISFAEYSRLIGKPVGPVSREEALRSMLEAGVITQSEHDLRAAEGAEHAS